MKVAIVYDRVNKWGGAERVLLVLHEIFPQAPLYTTVYNSSKAPWAKVFPSVITSFLQKVPFLREKHELLGWLTPLAFESFDFSGYDLVISVTSEAAKGIITRPPTKHICYCLTPTRYLWSGYDQYFRNKILKFISKPAVNYLRDWDKIAAQRPDGIMAISSAVKERIRKYYQREAEVIFPPVDVQKFEIRNSKFEIDKYYLIVSRLVPYKKVDLAVKAFNQLALPLVIVGTGSEEKRLRKMAKNNIRFVKNLTDQELTGYYQDTVAFIMPQEEDFGLAAVEAQSAGVPVIAYKAGGALDIVKDGRTGIFFEEQNGGSLIKAIRRFERMKFNKMDITEKAKRFSKNVFVEKLKSVLEEI